MSKVILSGFINVPANELSDIEKELPRHIRLTRDEPGCEVFEVTQVEADPRRFNVYEVFSSEADFARHQERVRNSEWGVLTQNVERHYTIDK